MYTMIWIIAVMATFIVLAEVAYLVWDMKSYTERRKDEADEYYEKVKTRTDNKYNKYAALSPTELDARLTQIMALQLELCSITHVSEADPNSVATLYVNTLASIIDYIGDTSIEAIDYYYGDNYVVKWVEARFKLLENHGDISRIIKKELATTQIERSINE